MRRSFRRAACCTNARRVPSLDQAGSVAPLMVATTFRCLPWSISVSRPPRSTNTIAPLPVGPHAKVGAVRRPREAAKLALDKRRIELADEHRRRHLDRRHVDWRRGVLGAEREQQDQAGDASHGDYARARLGAGMAAGPAGADQLVCGARFSTSQPYSRPE